MGVIKSNAYGHDLEIATKALDDAIDGYGVVRMEEALKIREIIIKANLGHVCVYSSDAYDALKQIIFGLSFIQYLNCHWQSNTKMICSFG